MAWLLHAGIAARYCVGTPKGNRDIARDLRRWDKRSRADPR
jgi:hypothetical protein